MVVASEFPDLSPEQHPQWQSCQISGSSQQKLMEVTKPLWMQPLVPGSQGNKRTGFSWAWHTASPAGLRWREQHLPSFFWETGDGVPSCSGIGVEDETTVSVVVGGWQPHLWPGEGRVKEGTKNEETTFIPKVALRLKAAGQTLSPTRQQNSSHVAGTGQRTACPDPLICTNTDCRSNIQAQLWIFSQIKPLLYVIFKIHEPLPF